MVGLYQDSFIDYLKENLNCQPVVRSKNIVVRCPWCENESSSKGKHFHLWISKDSPIFKCFGGGCGEHGILNKLVNKISGNDITNRFVDQNLFNKLKKENLKISRNKTNITKKIILPELRENKFINKTNFIRSRIKYHNISLQEINGLVFDIKKFVSINKIELPEKIFRILDFFDSNFVGFLSKNQTLLMLRNIDGSSTFKHYKMEIQKSRFLDYYQINGLNRNSDDIIVSEGIYDILSEHIFDNLNIKKDIRLYAAGFSTSYQELFKSLSFHEQIFRLNVHILSDRDVNIRYYEKIKKYNNHLIENMIVYYNKYGKDFNVTPCSPVKFMI